MVQTIRQEPWKEKRKYRKEFLPVSMRRPDPVQSVFAIVSPLIAQLDPAIVKRVPF